MNYKFLVLSIIVLFFLLSSNDAKDKKSEKSKIATVIIGNQVWMKKNINVENYRNGDPIPEVKDPQKWTNLTTGAWCYYENDPKNGKTYGKLYNWYAVNDPRGLSPEGWHIPTEAEWTELKNCLGGSGAAGGKLKEKGRSHWDYNTGATNESGFTALPGGWRITNGKFGLIGASGGFWSSTDHLATTAWYINLFYSDESANSLYGGKDNGYSVRCIKD